MANPAISSGVRVWCAARTKSFLPSDKACFPALELASCFERCGLSLLSLPFAVNPYTRLSDTSYGYIKDDSRFFY